VPNGRWEKDGNPPDVLHSTFAAPALLRIICWAGPALKLKTKTYVLFCPILEHATVNHEHICRQCAMEDTARRCSARKRIWKSCSV